MLLIPSQNSNSRVRLLAFLLVLLGVLAFTVRGYHDEREALHFRDFKGPYSSARCLLKQCDPYSESETRAAFLAAGGVDDDKIVFDPYSILYPPFSLAALTPLAALPYPVTHAIWKALIAGLFSGAVLLTAELCSSFGISLATYLLLAGFAFSSTILLMLGQISGIVIPLIVIGFACLVRERFFPVAVICFFAAVILKPHDAAIPLVYLLVAGARWRRVFVAVMALSIVFAVISIAWFASEPHATHWLSELRVDLQGASSMGSFNSPVRGGIQGINLAHLQAFFAVLRNQPTLYNEESLLVCAVLFAAWLVPAIRLRNSISKHVLAIAAIACLTLLPVYHRQYDTRILLLAFPAVAYLLSRQGSRAWGLLGLALLAAATVLTSHQFINHLLLRQGLSIQHASVARTLLYYRPIPEIILVLFLYLLGSMFQLMRIQDLEARAGRGALAP